MGATTLRRTHRGDDVSRAVARLGTVLCVFAHPDDESYLAGGLMAAAAARGQHVECVTATRGEAGGERGQRSKELASALAELGVRRHRFLDLPDGGCAALDDEPQVGRIAELVRWLRPDTVVTFGPDGATGHPDHIAVGRWTDEAVRRAAPSVRVLHAATTAERQAAVADLEELAGPGIYEPGYPVPAPAESVDLELALTERLLDRKVAALCAHGSQTAVLRDRMGPEGFRRWVAAEIFVAVGAGAAPP